MNYDKVILAQGCEYSTDTFTTGVNNNQLIVGGSGSGKTMSITEPCLLYCQNRNLIVTVTKKRIIGKYKPILEQRGYNVDIIDFAGFEDSTIGFDPLSFLKSDEDISFLARSIVLANPNKYNNVSSDPYWDEAAISLVSALIGAAKWKNSDATLSDVLELLKKMKVSYLPNSIKTNYEMMFNQLSAEQPDNPAIIHWESFCHLPARTAACVFSTLSTTINQMFNPNLIDIFRMPKQLDFERFANKKNVLFIVTSPVNMSLSNLLSVFYSTMLKELFEYAEKLPKGILPIPTHIICDDFATGAPIPNFSQYISIIREKGLSVTLLCQSESQLDSLYSTSQATTIINNCDTYVYTGSMDIKTAKSIGERMNIPADEVLNIPLGTFIIFRRGEKAKRSVRYPILDDPNYISLMVDNNIA